MRSLAGLLLGPLAGLLIAGQATAAIVARVDNSSQTMRVYVDGGLAFVWPVSTARRGFRTPPGQYRVQRMERMWYSRKYDWAPMPNAMFFRGGYAIHGTGAVRQLGRPASHGCVRLAPGNARLLFDMVRAYGGARVVVTD
jgi:lipoprotein-anchoring transpeptidase ErfK/SrfK